MKPNQVIENKSFTESIYSVDDGVQIIEDFIRDTKIQVLNVKRDVNTIYKGNHNHLKSYVTKVKGLLNNQSIELTYVHAEETMYYRIYH